MATAAANSVQQIRRVIPVAALPGLIGRRVDRLWNNEAYRLVQEQQMRFLLEHTERAHEVPALARAYAASAMMRGYLRYHPHALTRLEVRGADVLTARRDPGRSIVLSFLHHHRYDGLFPSLAHVGAPCHILTLPLVLAPAAPAAYKQHIRVVRRGGTIVPATGGTPAIIATLRPGMTLAIASDVPGHTPVTFLGRRVLASFGAARIATTTNSQVVLATHRRDERGGAYIQVDEPLEPSDFAGPQELLDEMLRRHGEAVLAWPEEFDTPRSRWGIIDG
jgi:lauroyl/myristoyl acyltransferase